MAIKIETGPEGRSRAIVEGSMTIYEAAADKPVLLDAVAKAEETEIDLSSVREMDTAGLQLLILAKRPSSATALAWMAAAKKLSKKSAKDSE